jgi:hypothetical protein
MRALFLALAVLFLADAAYAQASTSWTRNCDGTGGTTKSIGPGSFACFYFEQLGVVDSVDIECASPSCVFHFDPDASTDGVGTATVWIRKCGDPAAITDNQCPRILDAALTGLVGDSLTQNFTKRVGRGHFYIEVVGDGADTDDPFVSITGEN